MIAVVPQDLYPVFPVERQSVPAVDAHFEYALGGLDLPNVQTRIQGISLQFGQAPGYRRLHRMRLSLQHLPEVGRGAIRH